jgi:signal transduction histidine kinase/CheY-like chemotaxis protein
LSRPDRLTARHTAETACDGHWYRFTIDPVTNPQGLSVGAVCVLSDITGRKQAEGRLRFLSEASAELSVLIDVKSTVQASSRLPSPFCADWCIITTAGPLALGSATASADKSPPHREALDQFAVAMAFPLDPAAVPVRPVFATDGKENWLSAICKTPEQVAAAQKLSPRSLIVAPLVIRDRVLGLMYLGMGESGRRHTERDLPFVEDLAQRIAIALENARLYRDALDADRRKDEFLAMLAHELRNPLAPICNALSILREQDVPPEAGRELRSIIERQVDHLVRLVGDLLDMSRIVRGRIELRIEPVELSKIVEHAVETVRPLLDERGHQLTVSLPAEPIWLDGDLIRLAQVFANLLNNAGKYTNPGGRIDVIAEPEPGGVVVLVRDNGIGIAPEVLPKIFDLFTQLERSIARSEGGLGIGLTLVRNLTEMHGGTVIASSRGQGLGSEFAVYLPTRERQSFQTSAPAAREPMHGLRVAVVEDNFGSASILARLLTQLWQHDVRVAHDGLAALNLMREFHPHVALIDIGLPGISGYELASRLRQEREFDSTLLVAVTGYGQEEDRRRSQESGFNAHQVKPTSVDSLKEIFSNPQFAPLWEADLRRVDAGA